MFLLTVATIVVTLLPPAAPTTSSTSPSELMRIAGHTDDIGALPGAIKLAGDGGKPKKFDFPGTEKSSISSFSKMPVRGEMILQPKL